MPKYAHVHFPKVLYSRSPDGTVLSDLCVDAETRETKFAGWFENPDCTNEDPRPSPAAESVELAAAQAHILALESRVSELTAQIMDLNTQISILTAPVVPVPESDRRGRR